MSMAIKWQFYKNKFAWNFAGLSGEYREYHVIFLKVLGEHSFYIYLRCSLKQYIAEYRFRSDKPE
jgi:hypothetical protein